LALHEAKVERIKAILEEFEREVPMTKDNLALWTIVLSEIWVILGRYAEMLEQRVAAAKNSP